MTTGLTLVDAASAGEPWAQEALVQRYRRLVHSIPLHAYEMSKEDAEDVFQQVMLRLVENLGRLRLRDDLAAWLAAVTHNECRSLRRRAARWRGKEEALRCEPAADRTGDQPEDTDTQLALNRALVRLEPQARELLHALFFEDPAPSYEVIAQRLGCPIGSIGPTRARCLAKLRTILFSPTDSG